MADAIGRADYELSADQTKLIKALAEAETKIKGSGQATEQAFGSRAEAAFDKPTKAAGRFGGVMDGLSTKTSKLGALATGAVAGLAAGGVLAAVNLVTSGINAMTDAVGASIDKASDFSEAQSKVGVVFGDSAASIEAFAKTADRSLGLSSTAALGFAGTFGNLFTNLELGQPAAAEMSQKLIQLGGDLASFNNIPTTDALDKLRAGLAGESEPLRTLGVFLTEAKVQAEAMALGLVSVGGELTEAAKVQARYSLILKETSLAQGDFARTANGKANQDRINAARMENAWTRVGQVLMPLANTVMPMVADAMVAIVEGIGSVISGIGAWVDQNQGLMGVLGALADIIGTVLVATFQTLAVTAEAAFTVVSTVVGGVFDVVKAAVSGIIGAIRNVMDIAAQIPGPWQEGAAAVSATLDGMQASVESWGTATATLAGKAADDIVTNTATGLADGAGTVGTAATTGLGDPIAAAAGAGHDAAVAIASRTPQDLADELRDKRTAWQKAVDQLGSDLEDRMSSATEIAKIKAALVGDNLKAGLKSKDPVVKAQAEATKRILTDRLDELEREAKRAANRIAAALPAALEASRKRTAAAAASMASSYSQYLYTSSPSELGPFSKDGGPSHWGWKLADGFINASESRLRDFDLSAAIRPFGGLSRMSLATASAPASAAAEARSMSIGDIHVHLEGGVDFGRESPRVVAGELANELRLTMSRMVERG